MIVHCILEVITESSEVRLLQFDTVELRTGCQGALCSWVRYTSSGLLQLGILVMSQLTGERDDSIEKKRIKQWASCCFTLLLSL